MGSAPGKVMTDVNRWCCSAVAQVGFNQPGNGLGLVVVQHVARIVNGGHAHVGHCLLYTSRCV